MKTITFDLKGCPGTTPDPITVPEIQCVSVDEIKAAEAKPGSRTLLVTPYGGSDGEKGICSGQYGQWQILMGFGGQINRGLYCGDSFEKKDGYSNPGVSSEVDCDDEVFKGTKCIAMRERGRWFVFCPKGTGGACTEPLPWVGILCKGGNYLSGASIPGIKRVAGEAKSDRWIFISRQAQATCTIAGGQVNQVSLADLGQGYESLPPVTVSPPPTGGVQAVLTPALVEYPGSLEGVYITACGSNYTQATVTFSAPPSGGTLATGVAVLRDGRVVGINLTNAGKGYLSTPTVSISGNGSSAAATAVRSKNGITLVITTPGSGYLVAPTITVGLPTVSPLPVPAPWSDGIGWGIINGGSLTGGYVTGLGQLIVHDDRAMVAYGLMGDNTGAPTARAPDSILSWYRTLVRLTFADPLADGVLPAWVPMSGGV